MSDKKNTVDPNSELAKAITLCRDSARPVEERLALAEKQGPFWFRYFVVFCRDMTLEQRLELNKKHGLKQEGWIAVYSPGLSREERVELAKSSYDNPISKRNKIDALDYSEGYFV